MSARIVWSKGKSLFAGIYLQVAAADEIKYVYRTIEGNGDKKKKECEGSFYDSQLEINMIV